MQTRKKLSDFTEAMTEIYGGFDERYVAVSESRFEEGGYEAMKKLIESGNIPRAIICAYDNMTVGAVRCLYDYGLKVPDDVAFIGYDDNAESKFMIPSLSSIDIMNKECAACTVDMIISKIFSKPCKNNVVFKAELRLRESSDIKVARGGS